MQPTHAPGPGSTPPPSAPVERRLLFGRPALPAPPRPAVRPHVSAVATGTFKLARARIVDVDVHVDGIVLRALVRLVGGEDARVVLPLLRGDAGVRFSDPAVTHAVNRAAVEAAQYADRRGWLA